MESWEFDAELWEWDEEAAAWVFLTVPADVGDELRMLSGPPRGFGSVRVEATIGSSTWRTSVFPDKKRGFLLPVKRAVRRAEALEVGDMATVRLRLL